MNGLNISSSVIGRRAQSANQVINNLRSSGWQVTGSLGDRVTYLESGGIGITVVSGGRGTVVLPSGPIRGRVFGEESGLRANLGDGMLNFSAGPDIRNRLPDVGGDSGFIGNGRGMMNNRGMLNNNDNNSSGDSGSSEEDDDPEPEQPQRKGGISSGSGDFV